MPYAVVTRSWQEARAISHPGPSKSWTCPRVGRCSPIARRLIGLHATSVLDKRVEPIPKGCVAVHRLDHRCSPKLDEVVGCKTKRLCHGACQRPRRGLSRIGSHKARQVRLIHPNRSRQGPLAQPALTEKPRKLLRKGLICPRSSPHHEGVLRRLRCTFDLAQLRRCRERMPPAALERSDGNESQCGTACAAGLSPNAQEANRGGS